jgi:Spy/CpxP family protein refolding chaperone
MKIKLTVLAGGVMLLGGTLLCQAMPGPGNPPPPGCGGPAPRGDFPAGLARILELSEVQKGQIRAIFSEEKEKVAARHKKESELRDALHLAEHAATFNEQAIRRAAAALAGLETEGVVARAKTHYQVDAVLTQAQRSLAERLRLEREGEEGPNCGAEHERRPQHGPENDHDRR